MKGSDLTVRMLELRRKWEAAEEALSAQAEIIHELQADKAYLTRRNVLWQQYARWLEGNLPSDPNTIARARAWWTEHDPPEEEAE